MEALSGAYATFLAQERERTNAQVAALRHHHRHVRNADVARLFRDVLAPIYAALVASESPRGKARAPDDDTMRVVHEVAYTLCARRLLKGGNAATPAARSVSEAWQVLVPALAPLIRIDPRRVLVATTHAVLRLAQGRGERAVRTWTNRMLALAECAAPSDDDAVTLWLAAGQVAAWREGLAHYRDSALEKLATLDDARAQLALGAPADETAAALHARLSSHPLAAADGGVDRGRTWRVGGLSGFLATGSFGAAGRFDVPPFVAQAGEAIFVKSADDAYRLFVDAFGQSLVRVEKTPPTRARVETSHLVATVHRHSHAVYIQARGEGAS